MDVERSLRLYRRNAPFYDVVARAFAGIRTTAITRLAPRPGETILDVACVVAGVKLASGPLSLLANAVSRVLSPVGVVAPLTVNPWRALEELLGRLDVTELRWGTAYVAGGTRRIS